MKFSMVLCMTSNGCIGNDGMIPFHCKADIALFKEITMEKVLICGRRTFESIGKMLPGRKMVVMSRDEAWRRKTAREFTTEIFGGDLTLVSNLEEAFAEAASLTISEEVMVIGGAEIYRQAAPYCKTAYVTLLTTSLEGDTKVEGLFNGWEPEGQVMMLPRADEDTSDAIFLVMNNPAPKAALPQPEVNGASEGPTADTQVIPDPSDAVVQPMLVNGVSKEEYDRRVRELLRANNELVEERRKLQVRLAQTEEEVTKLQSAIRNGNMVCNELRNELTEKRLNFWLQRQIERSYPRF